MDQRPEAGRIEVENGSHKINDGVIVHQPSRHDPEQCFCDRQLAGRGRAMEEKQFHAVSIANRSTRGNR
jgi:anti-sigma factor ChrR (cupin superfamily)